jgi:CBS domain-containing protein
MRSTAFKETEFPLVLNAETAADLMTANPISLRATATVRQSVALLIDRGFSAAPVIDRAGRPVGVLSRADLLVHDRERVEYVAAVPDYYERTELKTAQGELLTGFEVENVDTTTVEEMMTPVVFSVTPDTPARQVVARMIALKVHRLFVVDSNGALIGVISAMDVLRFLQ